MHATFPTFSNCHSVTPVTCSSICMHKFDFLSGQFLFFGKLSSLFGFRPKLVLEFLGVPLYTIKYCKQFSVSVFIFFWHNHTFDEILNV